MEIYMNAVIKIYGAPLVFDLYGGTSNEMGYFQIFDSESADSEKLTIHRLSDSQITYNYLRYGILTSGGRDGSFFGMTVIFSNSYCADFKRISDLFRAVYKTILDKGVLFETVEQNTTQIKYKIRKFSDVPEEVTRIESILLKNIHNALADSIKPLESNSLAQDDKEIQFNDSVDNESINEALKKYSTVSISPKYIDDGKGTVIDIIPQKIKTKINDALNGLKQEVKVWIDDFRKFQSKVLTLQSTTSNNELKVVLYQEARPPFQKLVDDANRLKGQLLRIANMLSPYQDKKLSKEDSNYLREREIAYGKRCEDLDYYVNELAGYNKLFAQGDGGGGSGSGGGIGKNGDDGNPPQPWPWWKIFIDKHKKSLIAASAALVLIIGLLVWHNHKGVGRESDNVSTVETQCDSIMSKVREEISANQWVNAYKHCNEITENEVYNGYGRLQDVTDTMDLCRNNYKEYCLSQCIPEKYAKKEDATQWFIKEMETVDCWDYIQEIQTIESRYPVAKLPQPTDSSGKKPSKNTESTTSKYTIVLYQDGQPITGKITKKKEITLKCLENGNKAVTVSNWKVGTSNKPDGKFTPQEKDKSFRISCTIKGKTVEKTIECDIQGGPGGTHM